MRCSTDKRLTLRISIITISIHHKHKVNQICMKKLIITPGSVKVFLAFQHILESYFELIPEQLVLLKAFEAHLQGESNATKPVTKADSIINTVREKIGSFGDHRDSLILIVDKEGLEIGSCDATQEKAKRENHSTFLTEAATFPQLCEAMETLLYVIQ